MQDLTTSELKLILELAKRFFSTDAKVQINADQIKFKVNRELRSRGE